MMVCSRTERDTTNVSLFIMGFVRIPQLARLRQPLVRPQRVHQLRVQLRYRPPCRAPRPVPPPAPLQRPLQQLSPPRGHQPPHLQPPQQRPARHPLLSHQLHQPGHLRSDATPMVPRMMMVCAASWSRQLAVHTPMSPHNAKSHVGRVLPRHQPTLQLPNQVQLQLSLRRLRHQHIQQLSQPARQRPHRQNCQQRLQPRVRASYQRLYQLLHQQRRQLQHPLPSRQ
mmetsp:Transcript_24811/g.74625  ORF Transcript_24811/g.74625 Transcript_24811/m.74625 type:complete len:226 (-) Transcript_24811:560-1237(-)